MGERPPAGFVVAGLISTGVVALVSLALASGCSSRTTPQDISAAIDAPAPSPESLQTERLPLTVSPAERADYLGSQACAPCHRLEAAQSASRHAQSLSAASGSEHRARFQQTADLIDPVKDVIYSTAVKKDRCVMVGTSQGKRFERTADYAFGTGAVAVTYLSRTSEGAMELRLTHYGHADQWDFTPGQGIGSDHPHPLGKPLSKREEEMCFRCHSTALVSNNGELDLSRSILGITCETCHGPGRKHVVAVKQGASDLEMERFSKDRQSASVRVCGLCHRAPDKVDMTKPGMESQLPRLQALALSRSDCFTKGKVSCMTCHNPHQDAKQRSQAEYNAICMSCHQPAKPDTHPCPKEPTGDCVTCHMPDQDIGMPTSPMFHTHWIKVWKEQSSAKAHSFSR